MLSDWPCLVSFIIISIVSIGDINGITKVVQFLLLNIVLHIIMFIVEYLNKPIAYIRMLLFRLFVLHANFESYIPIKYV